MAGRYGGRLNEIFDRASAQSAATFGFHCARGVLVIAGGAGNGD
jgi:hypothetical protein